MASATAHKELSKISLHKRSFMESKMDYEFIKDMLPAIAGLIGAIIGFCGAIYQCKKVFSNEQKMLLLKDRKAVYLEALELVQDYQQHKKNNKKYDISDEDLHSKIYCLQAKMNIYGSAEIIELFRQAIHNIESKKDDKEFTKFASAIRSDLCIE